MGDIMRYATLFAITGSLLALSACKRAESPAPAETPPPPAAVVPAETTPPTVVTPTAETRSYQCGELPVNATFRNTPGDGVAELNFSGTTLTLPHVQSGSGARYADEQGNEFWSKGEEAMFTVAGQEMRNCTPAASAG